MITPANSYIALDGVITSGIIAAVDCKFSDCTISVRDRLVKWSSDELARSSFFTFEFPVC
jgi:hypothetical protein